MNKVKIFLKYFFTVILLFIIILLLSILSSKFVFKDKIPNAFGYSILRVVSGSMEPNIKVGNFVLIKNCKSYKKGDVVTFVDSSNNVVTHRIIKINKDEVVTKGDANNTDDGVIHLSDIQGKVIYQFSDIFRYKDKIIIVLIGLFVIGGLITICIPSRKK